MTFLLPTHSWSVFIMGLATFLFTMWSPPQHAMLFVWALECDSLTTSYKLIFLRRLKANKHYQNYVYSAIVLPVKVIITVWCFLLTVFYFFISCNLFFLSKSDFSVTNFWNKRTQKSNSFLFWSEFAREQKHFHLKSTLCSSERSFFLSNEFHAYIWRSLVPLGGRCAY